MRVLALYVLASIGSRAYRAVVIGALFGFIATLVWILLLVPPIVGFGVSAAFAVAWCIWLEKHPEIGQDGKPPQRRRRSQSASAQTH